MKKTIVLNLVLFLALVNAPEVALNFAKSLKLEPTKTPTSKIVKAVKITKEKKQNPFANIKVSSNKKFKKTKQLWVKTDYTPVKIDSVVSRKEAVRAKISYQEVKKHKKDNKKLNAKNVTVKFEKKSIIKRKVEKIEIELSYNEVDEQNKVEAKKLNKVSWSNFNILNSDYSKEEANRVAEYKAIKIENENKIDRISTKAAATEKSTIVNVETSKLNVAEETFDELVFFDYDESEEAKVVTQKKEQTVEEAMEEAKPIIKAESLKLGSEVLEVEESKPATVNTAPVAVPALIQIQNEIVSKVKVEKVEKKKPKKHAPDYSKIIRAAQEEAAQVAQVDSHNKGDNKSFDKGQAFTDEISTIASAEKKSESQDEEKDYACLDNQKMARKNYKAKYEISLDSINYNEANFEKIHNFEVRFSDDQDDIVQDYGEGKIDLELKTSGVMNIRRGILLTSNHYPTTVDFVFEGVSAQMSIPVFTRDSFDELIRSEDITGLGAQFLIEMDNKTEDVDLDVSTKYESKLYLNDSFKSVDRSSSDYKYILFVGVTPGNSIVYFKNARNEVTHKIVHFTEKEIYYEPNFYAEIVEDKMELFEENPMAKCKGLLNINEEKITPWSFEARAKKESVNQYKLGKMIYPLGTRKYYEVKHLNESVFIGRWDEREVVIPSEKYIDNVLGSFDTEASDCLVQLNLTKKLDTITVNGQSASGAMQPVLSVLDEDGNFYDEPSDKSDRIFVKGEEQGVINLKLKYTDGSYQYLQTYCSESTYLIEQL